jgi:hypothetical protein
MKIDSNLTKAERAAIVEANKTLNGGWTKEFLESIGVSWPPPQGWRGRFIEGRLSNKKAKQKHRLLKKRQGWTKTSCIVYGIRCPSSGDLRYIGQTRSDVLSRMKWHKKSSRSGNAPLYVWWRQLEVDPTIEVIDSKGIWDVTEAALIERAISKGARLLHINSVIRSDIALVI